MNIIKSILLQLIIFTHKIKLSLRAFCRKPSGIAIVRIDGVGDAIIFFHSISFYREIYPNEKLVLIYNDQWRDFAENIDLFDETIPINYHKLKTSLFYRLKLALLFSRRHFKVAINPLYFRSFFGNDWIVRQMNAANKIAFDGDYSNTMAVLSRFATTSQDLCSKLHANANAIYSKIIPADPRPKMVLLRDFEFVEKLGGVSIPPRLNPLPFSLPKLPMSIKLPYVLVNLGAGIESRMWSLDKMCQVINKIPRTYSIVFCGSTKERAYLQNLNNHLFSKENILDLIGKTSLRELCTLVKGCALLITNETSTSHIAVSVQCPSICLIGGGHFGLFHPYPEEFFSNETENIRPCLINRPLNCYNCNWRCKFPLVNGRWKCIDEIRVSDVTDAVTKVLKKNRDLSNRLLTMDSD